MIFFKKHLILFTVFVIFMLDSVQFCASAALVSFADHCTSIAADYSTPAGYAGVHSSVHSITGFYHTSNGSNIFLNQSSNHGVVQNSIVFRFWYDGAAEEQAGLFRVQGSLEFPKDTSTYYLVGTSTSSGQATDIGSESASNVQHLTSFKLKGIWSEASGELCMVGSGSRYSKQGNILEIPVVLKLHKLKNSSSLTSLISGTLESLVNSHDDPNYFGPISMSMLPSMNYQYSLASIKSHDSSYDKIDSPSSSLKIGRFCSVISNLVLDRYFVLKYPSRCLNIGLVKNCSPLSVSYVPGIVSLKNIECLEDKQKMRVLVDFSGSDRQSQWPFDPSATLVGEGSWDAMSNQVIFAACRFLNATDHLNTSYLGDCSVRLSFRFPSRWTIGNTSSIRGQIWSNQTAAESDYFENITFESGQNDWSRFTLPGQAYEYTKIDQVIKLCHIKKTGNENVNKYIYSHPFSSAMIFHISAMNSAGEEIGWGYSVPLSVGKQFYDPRSYSIEDGTEDCPLGSECPPVRHTYNLRNPHNISYRIDIKPDGGVQLPKGFFNQNSQVAMVISAEGMYDDTEGRLCMVGCRDLSTNIYQQPTNDSIDCEMVIHFEFRPPYPNTSSIIGSIESTRNKSDRLYFERVELTAAIYSYRVAQSKRRKDVEILLDSISNTVGYVSGILQLYHMRSWHPEIRPFISICMLYILGLGYMLPLYFDVHSSQSMFPETIGWLEFLELIVKVANFLLPLRFLLLTWLARLANRNKNKAWALGKLALLSALPVYVAGSFFALFMIIWGKRDYIVEMVSRYLGHDTLGTVLKTCAGLVLDWFLLPQIVLNFSRKSKEKSLAVSFFVGTTFVRVMPHAYALYKAHTSAHSQLNDSYIYPSSAAFYHSTSWNVVVPCGGLLFAVIIYMQQRFGGCCILPHKLRQFGE
ncbi:uncharacterized protein LOC126787076 [Argentina anserina]|uniref:uncharacterized protein LOC126787076 n=1 Tax=Argentina anserina TaxID=57926 RepID=UPI0021764718|nr:uncharacterized protein LOC126787076 [Potentilla anserina]